MTVGISVVLYGIAVNDLSRSLGGSCLTMTALTLLALVAIRRWVTDTRAERERLADATREQDSERVRLMALQAAVEQERQRLLRDAEADRRQNAARLEAERKALRAQFEAKCQALREQFEEDRAALMCKSVETAYVMFKAGLMDEQPHPSVAVLSFLEKSQQRAAERTHGQ